MRYRKNIIFQCKNKEPFNHIKLFERLIKLKRLSCAELLSESSFKSIKQGSRPNLIYIVLFINIKILPVAYLFLN